jgi:hypothetical protein
MPDPTIISRDPFQRAKADAEAKYGTWQPLRPTLSVCLASSVIGVAVAIIGVLGAGTDPGRAFEAITIVIGVATLLTYLYESHLLRKKLRLIDQRWQMLSAETARLRETCNRSWQGLVAQRQG